MTNTRFDTAWIAQVFVNELIVIYPVYAIMMQETGVSAFELSILFVIWSLSALLLEVPTGVLGDLFNRKHVLAAGGFCKAGGYAVWLIEPSFFGFAGGFVLWSVGGALRSGTEQALLYDSLSAQGRALDFAKVFGRSRAAGGIGVVTAMLIGGALAESGYSLPLMLSVAAPVISALLILGLIPDLPGRRSESSRKANMTLRTAFGEIRTSRVLVMLAGMFTLLGSVTGVLDEYIGPLLRETERFRLTEIGVWYGIVMLARTAGVMLAHRAPDFGLARIAAVFVLSNAILALSLLTPGDTLPLLLTACFFLSGLAEVRLESLLQESIESASRATITSLAQLGKEAWGIALFLALGLGAQWSSWSLAIGTLGACTLLLALGFLGVGASATHRLQRRGMD